jgi:hypothetical protein
MLYADSLVRKYSGLKEDEVAEKTASAVSGSVEQVFTTNEGPVVITTRGKLVFISESFPLEMGRKLTALILDAQGTGEMKMAGTTSPFELFNRPVGSSMTSGAHQPLTEDLVRFISNCGVVKAAVDAGMRSTHRLE